MTRDRVCRRATRNSCSRNFNEVETKATAEARGSGWQFAARSSTLMAGTISAMERPGGGARFVFTLPTTEAIA